MPGVAEKLGYRFLSTYLLGGGGGGGGVASGNIKISEKNGENGKGEG